VRQLRFVLPTLLSTLAAPAAAQLKLVALDTRVPIRPTPVVADGKTQLVYELRVTNLDRAQLTLTGIDIFADSGTTPIATRTGDELKGSARLAGQPATGDPRVLASGRQSLIYLWLTLPEGGRVPARLRHRVAVEVTDSANKVTSDTLDHFFVPLETKPPVVLAAPFTGGPWVAVNGPSNTSGHRRTAVPIYGEAQIGQRFATDWIKLGPDGLAFHGDSTVNANWYSYGTPVTAVADGIVTETKDGIIENVPLSGKMAVPITLETVGGNHVILDLGDGRFAFYAHLQPGSLKVKLGDRLRRGQVVGLLGNSGNSTAPHLHFHVTNGNSPLGSEGLPFVFERFELLDVARGGPETLLKGWHGSAPPVEKRREATLENMVVRFP
jgi:hypothetical protein